MSDVDSTAVDKLYNLCLNNNAITDLDDERLPNNIVFFLELSHNLIDHVTEHLVNGNIYVFLNMINNYIGKLYPMIFYGMLIWDMDLINNMLLEKTFIGNMERVYLTTVILSNNPIVNLEKNIDVNKVLLSNCSLTSCAICVYGKTEYQV